LVSTQLPPAGPLGTNMPTAASSHQTIRLQSHHITGHHLTIQPRNVVPPRSGQQDSDSLNETSQSLANQVLNHVMMTCIASRRIGVWDNTMKSTYASKVSAGCRVERVFVSLAVVRNKLQTTAVRVVAKEHQTTTRATT
jgi:hypothetical protein